MLDMRTLLILTIIFSYTLGVIMIVFSKDREYVNGFNRIGTGILLYGTGFLLVALRDFIPNFLSIILANTLLIFGIAVIRQGVVKFRGFNYRRAVIIDTITMTIFVSLMLFWTYYMVSINARIILVSVVEILYFGQIIFWFNYKVDQVAVKETKLVTNYVILCTIVVFVRAVASHIETPLTSLMEAGDIHGITTIFHQILPFVLTLSCLWISSRFMEEKLVNEALIDNLTGLYNKRAFIRQAEKTFHYALRRNLSIAVIMCDLDFFKKINDDHGHLVGDQFLKKTASVLKGTVRTEDIVARFGGEEFVILVQDIDEGNLKILMEKLRKNVEEMTVDVEGQFLSITMSFGGYVVRTSSDFEEAIGAADQALYLAKENGRNRCELYNDIKK